MRILSGLLLLSLTHACASTAGGQTGEEQRLGDAGSGPSSGGAPTNDPTPEAASPPEDPCLKGFLQDAPGETRDCKVVHAGRCFDGFEDACACLGCPEGLCNALFSDPGQVSCNSTTLPGCENGVAPIVLGEGTCEAMSMGLCFEDEADACACGGCDYPCAMTRSDPGQVMPCNR